MEPEVGGSSPPTCTTREKGRAMPKPGNPFPLPEFSHGRTRAGARQMARPAPGRQQHSVSETILIHRRSAPSADVCCCSTCSKSWSAFASSWPIHNSCLRRRPRCRGKFIDEVELGENFAFLRAQASATVEARAPTYYRCGSRGLSPGFARLLLPDVGRRTHQHVARRGRAVLRRSGLKIKTPASKAGVFDSARVAPQR